MKNILLLVEYNTHFSLCCDSWGVILAIILVSDAITNHHKLSGLKEHKSVILHFHMLEGKQKSHWAKFKVLAGLCSFLEALRENVSLTFLASRGCLSFLTHGSRSSSKPAWPVSHIILLSHWPLLRLSFPLWKTLVIILGHPNNPS